MAGYDESMTNDIDDIEDIDLTEDFDDVDEDDAEDLESLITEGADDEEAQPDEETEEQEEESEPQGTSGKRSEPGYVRKRVDEAVQKANAETEARVRSEERANFDQRLNAELDKRMAPILERLVEMDAQELLRKGTVKDIETARELARYRQGVQSAPAAEPKEQQRNEKGQFASQSKEDPATTARIKMLRHQADSIKAHGGPDVIAEFQNNPRVKQKVISGEMDFYDVEREMKAPKKRPPSPMRSPNGATKGEDINPIMEMSDKEFEKLERRVQSGTRIRQK